MINFEFNTKDYNIFYIILHHYITGNVYFMPRVHTMHCISTFLNKLQQRSHHTSTLIRYFGKSTGYTFSLG